MPEILNIALTIFLIFILIYIGFNAYTLKRIWLMRLPGDKTPIAIAIYIFFVAIIIIFTVISLSAVNWQPALTNLKG